jgi:hypothetical protein
MKLSFKFYCLAFLSFFTQFLCAQSIPLDDQKSFICFSCNQLQVNPKLEKALKKLHNVRVNNLKLVQLDFPSQSDNLVSSNFSKEKVNQLDTLFTIMHIGDSHIQGDYFTGEIRIQLQSRFGNAGRGILFPYALAKSYGPKGVSIKPSPYWTGLKTMSGSLRDPLGVTGYAAYSQTPYASFKLALTEKFSEENALGTFSVPEMQKIRIWHSTGQSSFACNLNEDFKLIDSAKSVNDNSWGVSSFQSNVPQNEFTLKLSKTDSNQEHYGFYGFEIVRKNERGVVYHHCGVVGAQFPHLINKAQHTIEQIAYLKPDILVFSFGTNEAYNGKLDTLVYTPTIAKFLEDIHSVSPNTAIILTTPPDTRSSNRIPPHQKNVINQFYKIAKDKNLAVYDLNAAMGGWGSLYHWFKNKLTISDKLHFNTAGYALQGQLFTLSLLEAYNRVNSKDTMNIYALKSHIKNTIDGFVFKGNDHRYNDSSLQDSTLALNPIITQDQSNQQSPRRKNIHIVKRGETVYAISRKYHLSPNQILKANKLKNSRGIKPGQRLIIPKR